MMYLINLKLSGIARGEYNYYIKEKATTVELKLFLFAHLADILDYHVENNPSFREKAGEIIIDFPNAGDVMRLICTQTKIETGAGIDCSPVTKFLSHSCSSLRKAVHRYLNETAILKVISRPEAIEVGIALFNPSEENFSWLEIYDTQYVDKDTMEEELKDWYIGAKSFIESGIDCEEPDFVYEKLDPEVCLTSKNEAVRKAAKTLLELSREDYVKQGG